MLKNKKCIIGLIAAVVLVAAAVTAIIIYREQISDFLYGIKEKITGAKQRFTSQECEDFADI